MVKLFSFIISIFFLITPLLSQFGAVKVEFDERLLRSDEKHDLINLKEDIRQFYTNTRWDKEYSDLNIPLNIQIIFEGAAAKGSVKTYLCKALFSNGSDLRYFDKGVQFFYSPGSSLYFDLVLFEPLSAFLAFYAYIILGGEIDTYDYKGGNPAYEIAREISLRGSSSDYQKGWSSRKSLVDDISKNTGLRSARLSYYLAKDLLNEGNIDEAIKEYDNMLDGLEQSYVDFRREQSTQFFMKLHSESLAITFSSLGRRDLLVDLKQLDPDNNELYQVYLDKMSK
ncbi:MAG: hypothetical protein CMG70_06020 [Candidatus Marinimicrobia bacterium]|nr:hypothetical protein [Candidatus Neomarinimicrobiota bacterium]|tara:strand:- start:31 stop:879 length:849 start_codon:yes stop_codon:yes gene_type:complete